MSDNTIEEIRIYLKSDLENLQNAILEQASINPIIIENIIKNLANSGGKRVRSIILILASKLCGYKSNADYRECKMINLAASIELIHLATLLHDDVVDDNNIRHGVQTANKLWGNKYAILVGDYVLAMSFKHMTKSGIMDALELLSHSSGVISRGEIIQLSNIGNINTDQAKYFEIIEAKTASLFSSAAKVGAIISECNNDIKKNMEEFGRIIGVIFQITDDILDYKATNEKFGKKIGIDFLEKKMTLPLILTYQNAIDKDRELIKTAFENGENLDLIISLMEKYEAIEKIRKMLEIYKKTALDILDKFPNSREKEMLAKILDYFINRGY